MSVSTLRCHLIGLKEQEDGRTSLMLPLCLHLYMHGPHQVLMIHERPTRSRCLIWDTRGELCPCLNTSAANRQLQTKQPHLSGQAQNIFDLNKWILLAVKVKPEPRWTTFSCSGNFRTFSSADIFTCARWNNTTHTAEPEWLLQNDFYYKHN